MKKDVWIKVGLIVLLTIISIAIVLNISPEHVTDYLLSTMMGFMISNIALPEERPGLIGDRIAIGVILFAPIIAIYVVMPFGAILSYLIGILIALLLSKKKFYSY